MCLASVRRQGLGGVRTFLFKTRTLGELNSLSTFQIIFKPPKVRVSAKTFPTPPNSWYFTDDGYTDYKSLYYEI